MTFEDESLNRKSEFIRPLKSFFAGPLDLFVDIILLFKRKLMSIKIPQSFIEMILNYLKLTRYDVILFSFLRVVDQQSYKIFIYNDHVVAGVASCVLEQLSNERYVRCDFCRILPQWLLMSSMDLGRMKTISGQKPIHLGGLSR